MRYGHEKYILRDLATLKKRKFSSFLLNMPPENDRDDDELQAAILMLRIEAQQKHQLPGPTKLQYNDAVDSDED